MSNETEESPLHAAYVAAVFAVGRQKANAVVKAHGSTDNTPNGWRKIPANRQAAATKALQALVGGTQAAAKAAASFADVRRESFKRLGTTEREAAKPAAKLDPAAIYERWNSAVRPNED
jgi:hypothetical protein